ncbi:hypothetical protein T265_00771 [Opisthorchis viverrini]|uniref:C2H2-type domain-containing protein n=1 Tax=Opisthorchis viverrini TaxID=6198 RepID=A0A075A1N6_OPIVI|nr:hypothetical protein T265_00771 [Opisthorchis viverrini]KER33261.1 hypothetical protein T265_00771 [Opisthorchis viverrini]
MLGLKGYIFEAPRVDSIKNLHIQNFRLLWNQLTGILTIFSFLPSTAEDHALIINYPLLAGFQECTVPVFCKYDEIKFDDNLSTLLGDVPGTTPKISKRLRPNARKSCNPGIRATRTTPKLFVLFFIPTTLVHSAHLQVSAAPNKTWTIATVSATNPVPAERTRDCVCEINCNDCAKVYIGQTARELHTRIGEHKRRSNKPPRIAEEYQTLVKDSAMVVHALDTEHRIDLENVEVLRRGLRFTPQRLIAEAVEITKHHSVNRIEDVELASEWKAVLDYVLPPLLSHPIRNSLDFCLPNILTWRHK